MKAITLTSSLKYPQVIAYYETNNMGDQLLTFRKENKDGSVNEIQSIRYEGEHIFSKKDLLAEYNLLTISK